MTSGFVSLLTRFFICCLILTTTRLFGEVQAQTAADASSASFFVNSTVSTGVSPITGGSNVCIVTLAVLLNPSTNDGARCYEAILLAINDVNHSPRYNTRLYIQATLFNTANATSQTVTNYANQIIAQTSPPYLAIMGENDPILTSAVNVVLNSSSTSLLQFSTVTTEYLVTTRKYFRLSPSDSAQVDAMVDYAFYANITRLYAIICNDPLYGPAVSARLTQRTQGRGILIASTVFVTASNVTAIFQNNLINAITSIQSAMLPAVYDTINNRTVPRLLLVLLPTFTYSLGTLPADVAFANAANSTQLLISANNYLLILSSDLLTAYRSIWSQPSQASTAQLAAASLMELVVGIQPAVGIFKTDSTLLNTFNMSNTSLTMRYYYDSVLAIAKSMVALLLNGTDPNLPSKFPLALSQTMFVGSSGSFGFTNIGERKFNRFGYAQLSRNRFGSTTFTRIFAYYYSAQGFVPNNASYRVDTLIQEQGAANFLISQPKGMAAYIPGYWQWTPLPFSGIPPSPRFGHCMRTSSESDTLFVYSGTYSSAQSPSTDAYYYSYANMFWSQIPISGTTKPRPAFYSFCGLHDTGGVISSIPNALYVFGGVNTDGVKGELWRMDIFTYAWKNMHPVTSLGTPNLLASSSSPSTTNKTNSSSSSSNNSSLVTSTTNIASSLMNTISLDRAEGGYVQLADNRLLIVGGFHRTQDQESVTILDMNAGDNASFTVYTPVYNRYSFLQNKWDWLTRVTLVNGQASSNPIAEMAAALNLDPNPILASVPWTDSVSARNYTLVFIIGGGLMPLNTNLIYRVEDNTVFPFFHFGGKVTAPDGSTAPTRDISLTVSALARNGYLYIADGWSDANQVNYNYVWQLDITCTLQPFALAPTCGTWTWLATKPTETRDSYRPFLYGTDMVMFGGWGASVIHNDMYTFSIVSNEFMNVAPDYVSPVAREFHSTVLIGNLMVIFGGLGLGSVQPTPVSRNDVWQYDIDAGKWSIITPTTAPPAARYGHTAVAVNIAMYMFGGTDGNQAFSDLWRFSLSSSSWSKLDTSASPNGVPQARVYHVCVGYKETEMILYGGQDSNGNYLSDMWRYNLNSQIWVNVFQSPFSTYNTYNLFFNLVPIITMVGMTPVISAYTQTPNITVVAANYVCPKAVVFNTSTSCYPLNVTQAAAVVVGNTMYYIGGWDAAFNSQSQVCTIDISNFNYPPYNTLVSATVPLPPSLYLSANQTAVRNGQLLPIPTSIVYSLENPSNYAWNCSRAPLPSSRNALAAVASGDCIFVYGGTKFELMNSDLLCYSMSRDVWLAMVMVSSSVLPRPRADTSAIMYGNKFLLFGGSMAGLGTIRSGTFLANEHWAYVLGPACALNSSSSSGGGSSTGLPLSSTQPTFSDCTPCSAGTVVIGTTCQSCPAGTYSSSSSNTCTPCPAGFYNRFSGATSDAYCLPCDSGTFNSLPGASVCSVCSTSQYCPVATTTPANSSAASSSLLGQFQVQASPLTSNSNDITQEANSVAYAMCSVALFAFFVYLFLVYTDKAIYVQPVDMLYNLSHVAHFDKPLFRRKTMMGGGCTVVSFFVITYFIVSITLPFALDNYIETRSLVPNVSINDTIQAAMLFNVTLSGYPSSSTTTCTQSGAYIATVPDSAYVNMLDYGLQPCATSITVARTSFGPQSGTAATFQACQKYIRFNQTQCSVLFYCDQCKTDRSGNVSFTFAESNTFASQISWAVNSTAGYEGQNSTLWGYLKSESNQVFRGLSPPTIITATLTPTRHRTPYNTTNSSYGYTQFFITQTPGNKVLPLNFNVFDGIAVVFALTNQLSTLDVVVNVKLTEAQYISQLLGSISGAIAGLALVVSLFEEVEDVFLKSHGYSPSRRKQGTHGRLDQLYRKLAETLVDAENEIDDEHHEHEAKTGAGGAGTGGIGAVKKGPAKMSQAVALHRKWVTPMLPRDLRPLLAKQ